MDYTTTEIIFQAFPGQTDNTSRAFQSDECCNTKKCGYGSPELPHNSYLFSLIKYT